MNKIIPKKKEIEFGDKAGVIALFVGIFTTIIYGNLIIPHMTSLPFIIVYVVFLSILIIEYFVVSFCIYLKLKQNYIKKYEVNKNE